MRENRPSSLMSGVWKRSQVDETKPPRHTSTLLAGSRLHGRPRLAGRGDLLLVHDLQPEVGDRSDSPRHDT